MPTAFGPARLLVPALASLLAVFVACGGKTATVSGIDAGPTCVDINLSTYDHSCNVDTDCTLLTGGQVCSGNCDCGGTPVNISGQAAYQAALGSIQLGECPCPYTGTPRCVQSQCTLCGIGPNQPPGCPPDDIPDAAQPPPDAPIGPPDVAVGDAPVCVDIVLSMFNTSCNQASDCIDITTGQLCTGSCSCGGSTINRAGQAAYDSAISTVMLAACPCPAEGTPECVAGQCTICGPGGCDGG
jgi:hypothetical protein